MRSVCLNSAILLTLPCINTLFLQALALATQASSAYCTFSAEFYLGRLELERKPPNPAQARLHFEKVGCSCVIPTQG